MSYSPTGTTHPGHDGHQHHHHGQRPEPSTKGSFLERVDFGEAIDAAVGTTAIAVAGDQLLKAGGSERHRTSHLVKAGLGTAVALAALKMFSRDYKESHAPDSPKSPTSHAHHSEGHRVDRVKSPPHHTHAHEDGRHPGDYGGGDRLALVPTRSFERRSTFDIPRRRESDDEGQRRPRHRSQSPRPHHRR